MRGHGLINISQLPAQEPVKTAATIALLQECLPCVAGVPEDLLTLALDSMLVVPAA